MPHVPRLIKKLSFHKLRSKSVDDLHGEDWAFVPGSPLPPVPQLPLPPANTRSQTEPGPRLNLRQNSGNSSTAGTATTSATTAPGTRNGSFANSRSSTLVSSSSSSGSPSQNYGYGRYSENIDLLLKYQEDDHVDRYATPMPAFRNEKYPVSSSPKTIEYLPRPEYVVEGATATVLAVTDIRVEEPKAMSHDRIAGGSREIGNHTSVLDETWDMVKSGGNKVARAEAVLDVVGACIALAYFSHSLLMIWFMGR